MIFSSIILRAPLYIQNIFYYSLFLSDPRTKFPFFTAFSNNSHSLLCVRKPQKSILFVFTFQFNLQQIFSVRCKIRFYTVTIFTTWSNHLTKLGLQFRFFFSAILIRNIALLSSLATMHCLTCCSLSSLLLLVCCAASATNKNHWTRATRYLLIFWSRSLNKNAQSRIIENKGRFIV